MRVPNAGQEDNDHDTVGDVCDADDDDDNIPDITVRSLKQLLSLLLWRFDYVLSPSVIIRVFSLTLVIL